MRTSEQIWERLPKRRNFDWTFKQVDLLVTLARQGVSFNKIAEQVGRKPSTVRMFVGRHRGLLGIEKRYFCPVRGPQSQRDNFNRNWHGVIPCGHFAICKRWGSDAFYEQLRAADRAGVTLDKVDL